MENRLYRQNKSSFLLTATRLILLGEMDVYLHVPSKYKYLEEPNKVACRLIFFSHRGH